MTDCTWFMSWKCTVKVSSSHCNWVAYTHDISCLFLRWEVQNILKNLQKVTIWHLVFWKTINKKCVSLKQLLRFYISHFISAPGQIQNNIREHIVNRGIWCHFHIYITVTEAWLLLQYVRLWKKMQMECMSWMLWCERPQYIPFPLPWSPPPLFVWAVEL